jgi:hypothetical protein
MERIYRIKEVVEGTLVSNQMEQVAGWRGDATFWLRDGFTSAASHVPQASSYLHRIRRGSITKGSGVYGRLYTLNFPIMACV